MEVLDPCCGGRSFYFDKHVGDVLFCDLHPRSETLCDGRSFVCEPDMVVDFTDMPFDDSSFSLVVFDPPHLISGRGWQASKYGVLSGNWKDQLKKGFAECWRVLRTNGTLVFKWNEHNVPLRELYPLFPAKPLFGNRKPGGSKTHWLVFFKGVE